MDKSISHIFMLPCSHEVQNHSAHCTTNDVSR